MSDLGKVNYEAFWHATGMGAANEWDKLSDAERIAWNGGAAAVEREVTRTPGGGQWMRIAFMGHVELTGYVTEVTIGGQAAFHVDLPEKLWGGNPLAWREYAAAALYSREPVTEESVRARWESQRRAQAAWEERERRYELEAAAQGSAEDDGECPETSDGQHTSSWREGGKCGACGQAGPQDDDQERF